jgi:hypothetical protein
MTDSEKIELALWALVGGTYWLGRGIKRGPAEYCVVKATTPYGGTEVVEESYHADPWESLKLARAHLQHCAAQEEKT